MSVFTDFGRKHREFKKKEPVLLAAGAELNVRQITIISEPFHSHAPNRNFYKEYKENHESNFSAWN